MATSSCFSSARSFALAHLHCCGGCGEDGGALEWVSRYSMAEIQQALAAGREVFAHSEPILVPGWDGAGYVIFDPDTGGGAWKISGGNNGTFLFWGTVLFMSIVIAGLVVRGQFVAAGFAFLAYRSFLDRVSQIGQKNVSPEQAYAELNEAAAMAVIGVGSSLVLSQMDAIGNALKIFNSALLWAFGKVWFNEPLPFQSWWRNETMPVFVVCV